MRDLLVIVPSRGRPGNVAALVDAWNDTLPAPTRSDLLVVVDHDDPKLDEYETLVDRFDDEKKRIEVGPRRWLGPTLNDVAVREAPNYRVIGFMGDDHRPRTPGWDGWVLGALENDLDGTGLVYCNDLLQGAALATQVFISSDVIRCLGFMVPLGMTHLYLDNFWVALGRALGRLKYLPNVVIEHMHPVAKKAPWDAGYAEVNSAEMYARDETTWRDYATSGFGQDVLKVRRELLGSS